jgi:predicted Zn-dependent peptidase
MENFYSNKLSSGVDLITLNLRNTRTASVMLFFGTGSRYENKKLWGASHLFEHVLFKGTKNHATPSDISRVIESKGGILNAFTDKEMTGYWCKIPSDFVEDGIKILAEMVTQPLLRQSDIDLEKKVVFEEINASNDSPDSRCSLNAENLIWPDQPMGRDIAGSVKSLSAIDKEDLVQYFSNQYIASNAVLVITGNIDIDRINFCAENAFRNFRSGQAKDPFPVVFPNKGPIVSSEFRDTSQINLSFLLKGYSINHQNKYALDLLSVILGESMSSRLFEEVREKRGLAYSINSFNIHFSDCGLFGIDSGVSKDDVVEAVDVICNELVKIKRNLEIKEIQEAKELVKGRLNMRLEDSRSIASFLGFQQLIKKKIQAYEEIADLLDSVTLEEINSVLEDIFKPDNFVLSIVGPVKDTDIFQDKMNL